MMKNQFDATVVQREAVFGRPDLGDLKGGVAPFFNTLLGTVVKAGVGSRA